MRFRCGFLDELIPNDFTDLFEYQKALCKTFNEKKAMKDKNMYIKRKYDKAEQHAAKAIEPNTSSYNEGQARSQAKNEKLSEFLM